MLKENKGYGEGARREDRSEGSVQSVNSRRKATPSLEEDR